MKVIVKLPNYNIPCGTIFDPASIYNETNYNNLLFSIENGFLEIIEGSIDDLNFIPKKLQHKDENTTTTKDTKIQKLL